MSSLNQLILNVLKHIRGYTDNAKYSKTKKAHLDAVNGVAKDFYDKRDFDLIKVGIDPIIVPSSIDLRKWSTDVKYQGSLNSCTGFGFGAAYEIMKNQMSNTTGSSLSSYDCSELFIYYNIRSLEGTTDKNVGCYLRDGCKALCETGAGFEEFWQYDVSAYMKKPDWIAYYAGKNTLCESYARIYSITDVKKSLVSGIPVVFGMLVYNNLFSWGKEVYNTYTGNNVGGHCMVIVGYDDSKNALLVKNSWGKNWGDKGYFWLDYDTYNKLLIDAWIVKPKCWNK